MRGKIWKILELFYKNKNQPLHLREIARQINLGESPATRHLNYLTKTQILKFKAEANLKKFYISQKQIPQIFPLYDIERFEELPLLRKNALKYYLYKLENKPILIVLFGSTAKGTFKEESDIDLIEVYNEKTNNKEAVKFAEAQTGLRINTIQITFKQYTEELKLKKDHVIQSGLETGFPVYNHQFFYEVLNNERV